LIYRESKIKIVKMLYCAYVALTSAMFISLFPAFWIYTRITGKYGGDLKERLGVLPKETMQCLTRRPRIWIHAASLGEVKVSASIAEAIGKVIPGCSLVVSTITEHGRSLARETFEETVPVIYAPIDFFRSVRRSLSMIRPDILIFLETEIWPVWIYEAHRMGIGTALVNGRISVRSVKRYLKVKPFFRDVLNHIDAFSMIGEADAARIQAMGADPERIQINGNAKYDLLGRSVNPELEGRMRQVLNLQGFDRVLIAGSVREGEERMILDAYEKILEQFPDTVLFIAPRHLERTQFIASLIESRGWGFQFWTDFSRGDGARTKPIVIVNVFGELFKIYSVGTIVFCGGSLVPLGGQNPLEPAAWGKVVFYGPSMENFSDAEALLKATGAGVRVSSPEEFAQKAVGFLAHPEKLKIQGERARAAVLNITGAGIKHARVISELWKSNSIS